MSPRKEQLEELLRFYKMPLMARYGTIGNARRTLREGLDGFQKNFIATFDAEKQYTMGLQSVIQEVVFGKKEEKNGNDDRLERKESEVQEGKQAAQKDNDSSGCSSSDSN